MKLDIALSESSNTIVITELCKRDEGVGFDIIKDKSRLSCGGELGREVDELTVKMREHGGATGRKDSGTGGEMCRIADMRSIRGGNEGASGAGIENGMAKDRGRDYDRVAGYIFG